MKQKDEKKVLVVDDEPDMLESVALLLSKRGYIVTTASNAKNAMEKIKKDNFDVVLTDIKMPGISGIELLEEINQFDQWMPVILMTAYADLDTAIAAIHKGAFDFISKPFKPDYLYQVLAKAILNNSLLRMHLPAGGEGKQVKEASIAGTEVREDYTDDLRDLTKAVLQQSGYKVVEAAEKDALQRYRDKMTQMKKTSTAETEGEAQEEQKDDPA